MRGGHSVPEMRSQIVTLRAHAEAQAAAIEGMERVRVMGEQAAELKAEIRIRGAALQAKDAHLQAAVQGKDSVLQASSRTRQKRRA